MKDLSVIQERLGLEFRKPALLLEALTHRSFLNECRGWSVSHNERLELLGDAVIELIVTEHLFLTFPEKQEGEITVLRSALVTTSMLGTVAEEIGLAECLLLSRGQALDFSRMARGRQYLCASAFEAVVGALYLDQGYGATKSFIERVLLSQLDRVFKEKLYQDPKSAFQEETQKQFSITPSYRTLSETGLDHNPNFVIGVYLEERLVALGRGLSKKEAEREAANKVLSQLKQAGKL